MSLGNNSKKSTSTQQSKSNECHVSIECDKPSSKVLESKELPTNDDVGVENSKPNKCTLSVDGKSHSKLSNNVKNSSLTHKSKSNERTLSLSKN